MELSEILRVVAGLIAVLGLIGLIAIAARKAGLVSASGGLVRQRRLGIVETLALDARRRLVIVKCDDTEHLLVLGANGETTIAQNIDTPEPVTALTKDETTPRPDNPFAILRALTKYKSNELDKAQTDLKRADLKQGDLKEADAA